MRFRTGRFLALMVVGGLSVLSAGVVAQEGTDSFSTVPWSGPESAPGGVVVIDQQGLFERSDFGRESMRLLEERSADLKAENRRIELALEEEERRLTARRANLPVAEFQALAEAFDRKVEGIRNEQDAKGGALARQRDAHQQQFFERAVPILIALMRDKGASAVLDRSGVVMSLDRIDITAEAIARVNQSLTDPPQDVPASAEDPQVPADPQGDLSEEQLP